MPPSAAADAGLRDTDTGAGMGEAVRRVCAMGFPESEARFALEAHSTYEEAIASLLDDGDGVVLPYVRERRAHDGPLRDLARLLLWATTPKTGPPPTPTGLRIRRLCNAMFLCNAVLHVLCNAVFLCNAMFLCNATFLFKS